MAKEVLKDEMLTDEQLDGVVGGSWMESTGDFWDATTRNLPGFERFRNYDKNDPDLIAYLVKNWTEGDNLVGKLKNMFASYGIEMTYNGKPNESNTYIYNGEEITNKRAWEIIDGK